ncbi:MAG TPA: WYL domain-containing protein [Acidimicrobiia bacterium]|nr:WYL domain-containing protein [Acidimicrobiia bacterium]
MSRTASRLTRILAMLPWVIANPGASVDEVCQRFGYKNHEDLARDLDVVFVCGLPGYGPGELMVAYIDGDEVVVDTADYFERAPRLTPSEALSMLASGMAILSMGEGSPALESAVDKLISTLAPDADGLAVDISAEPTLVSPLRKAAAEHRVVRITYTSLGSGETTERAIEPWVVFTSLGNWYVTGYCRLAQGERVFRLDRIRDLEPTDEEFEPPAEIPEPQVSYTPSDDDVRARIALSPSARWVLDYYPVDVVEDGPDQVVIDFSASDPLVAARLLLRLGTRARLLEGTEVAEALQALGQRVLARYS